MKFGPMSLSEAEGALLAHSTPVKSGLLKKGLRLSAHHLADLAAAGHQSIIAARLEAGDIHEDEAAHRIATALAGAHVRVAAPFTGRANLYADGAGLALIDPTTVAAINSVDEGLTIATLAPFERVADGQMIATVKIIPFAVSALDVESAERIARQAPLAVAQFHALRVGLIVTALATSKASVLDKRRRAIASRLAAMGIDDLVVETTAHSAADVAAALVGLQRDGAKLLLVFSASAIVDRADIVPEALVQAGGAIARLGMPVDPGNLLLLGTLGPTPVVGIPSCAASPSLNGFDWVLERLVAGLPVTPGDLAAMGVGGLLKEIASRPQPRDLVAEEPATARRAPRIGGVVLAAGRSTRMGSFKLLEDLAGSPLVRRTVAALSASRLAEIVVVTGHEAARVRSALDGLPVRFVDNPAYAEGISTSLKAGLSALSAEMDGALIALADMPEIEAGDVDRLIAAFAPHDGRTIVVPVRHAKRGNPVLWARGHFEEMMAVAGDTGARHLLGTHADTLVEVDIDSDAVLADIDTPEALTALRARFKGNAG